MSKGRYGSMVPAGRRKPDHPHQWTEPVQAGIFDTRLVKRCTVKGCGATKVLHGRYGGARTDG